jgi:hypothetical protein
MQIALGKGDDDVVLAEGSYDLLVELIANFGIVFNIGYPGPQLHIPGGIAKLYQVHFGLGVFHHLAIIFSYFPECF